MLLLSTGQSSAFEFIINEDNNFLDPTAGATPSDVFVTVYRGNLGAGAIVDGPFSYLYQGATVDSHAYIVKTTNNIFYYGEYNDNPGDTITSYDLVKFTFYYTVPNTLAPGNYSVVLSTNYNGSNVSYTSHFQITNTPENIGGYYASGARSAVLNFVPAFETLEEYKTNSVLLIGHADGLELNSVVRIKSIQEGINLLNGDFQSPLLRGVFDAYANGARDIYICPAAPMSEYVENISKRLNTLPIYSYSDATPMLMNFYQRYYDRLNTTYDLIKIYDNIDIVVPLETTILNSGGVDFMTQLANYCNDFHNESGFIQIGIIGSRSNGISSSDIDVLESNSLFTTKYTAIGSDGQIIGDMGRFIMPVYGEVIFNHEFLNITYTSPSSAAIAGILSQTQVNMGLARKRLSAVYGLHGNNLSQVDLDRIEDLGINTIYRSSRSRRGNAYEIYITNDYSMASPDSTLSKIPQIRLLAMLINEIKALSSNSISRFSSEKIIEETRAMLIWAKSNQIIVDYQFEPYVDKIDKGKLYFDISVTSALGLKKISFSISSGAGS